MDPTRNASTTFSGVVNSTQRKYNKEADDNDARTADGTEDWVHARITEHDKAPHLVGRKSPPEKMMERPSCGCQSCEEKRMKILKKRITGISPQRQETKEVEALTVSTCGTLSRSFAGPWRLSPSTLQKNPEPKRRKRPEAGSITEHDMACILQSSVDHNVASEHLKRTAKMDRRWDQTSRQNTTDDNNALVGVGNDRGQSLAQNCFNEAPASSAAHKAGRLAPEAG